MEGHFFTAWTSISFSRRGLLHGIKKLLMSYNAFPKLDNYIRTRIPIENLMKSLIFFYIHKKSGVDIAHIFSYWLIVTTLPWKLNWLFLGRPLLTAEYWRTMKSIQLVKPLSRILTFLVWALSTCIISFLMIPSMQFYLSIWSQ